ncbi:uncharacterized protein LOC121387835 isoform X2 [Gigantopelta aegis]|uniref:uncharacterized protein LOC121387835 isoform X2 n=1 Tax=Gigantopelta aegis TaxID=1735272 RepID=UPI001B88794A|nr:uncharacterized protein LOC121387835 isoform X2 [Gigantopelta aegis]
MTLLKHALITFAAIVFCSLLSTLIFINYIDNSRYVVRTIHGLTTLQQRDVTVLESEKNVAWYPIEVIHREVFVQSAIVNRHRSNSTHFAVVITAWRYYKHNNNSFLCCFFNPRGRIVTARAIFMFRHIEGFLGAHQFRCDLSKNSSSQNRVFFSATNCVDHVTKSIPVVFPERHEGKMAVCLKALYNKVSAQRLVEWFEIQKLQGVHKIQGFHFRLEKEAMMVLEYYRKQGYLILLPFEFPVGLAAPPGRGFLDVDRPNDAQFQADEQVMVFDCSARLSGYDYVGVYDVDEIVMPRKENITLPEFFKKMASLQPEAGAFIFLVEQFVTNWGRTNNNTDLLFMSYVKRMRPRKDRQKLVHLPSKVYWQDTHHAAAVERHLVSPVDPKIATLHHYRRCRNEKAKPCDQLWWFDDVELLRYEGRLKVNVDRVKRELEKHFNNSNIFKDPT